jgi:hypothetical protein
MEVQFHAILCSVCKAALSLTPQSLFSTEKIPVPTGRGCVGGLERKDRFASGRI